VPTFGSYLTMAKHVLVVKLKKRIVFECPINVIDHVAVEADGVAVSSRVISACAAARVPLTFCARSGMPRARLVPARSDLRPTLVDDQAAARSSSIGTSIATSMIEAKIRNQRAELLRAAKYQGRPEALRERLGQTAAHLANSAATLASQVHGSLQSARQPLLLQEARAAAFYWEGFGSLVRQHVAFERRRGRGAVDLVNVLLNYGYWHLFQRVWLAVERSGLHPFLGLLHTGRGRAPGLVLDLMEEFRAAVVDRAVLGLVARRTRLEVGEDGRLSLRSRRLATRALVRAFMRTDRAATFNQRIICQAAHLAGALRGHHPYAPYRSRW
jgi:CRISPR-associated protein Cas1